MGAVRQLRDGGSNVKDKIWGGIEKWTSRNAVANADIQPSIPKMNNLYTEQEAQEACDFLKRLKQYDIPYKDLYELLTDSVNMTIEQAKSHTQSNEDIAVVEQYLKDSEIRPGILYDGQHIMPVVYTAVLKAHILNNGHFVIPSYALLKHHVH
jgi:hypothetical protein